MGGGRGHEKQHFENYTKYLDLWKSCRNNKKKNTHGIF